MHHSIPAEHAQHDLDLIAGHAAGNLTDSQRSRADSLLRSCNTCANLRRDLVAIAAATRALPTSAHAPRDFRIDAAQAARLRRDGWLTRLLRPFAASRWPARPMAMAFTSLGLAGLLVVNILPSLLGGAASLAPERDQAGAGAAATAAAAPAASEAPVLNPVAGRPAASPGLDFGVAGQPTPEADTTGTKAGDTAAPAPVAVGEGQGSGTAGSDNARLSAELRSEGSPANLLLIGSLIFLAIGIALFGLRFFARRLR
jgi:hypothetical protein